MSNEGARKHLPALRRLTDGQIRFSEGCEPQLFALDDGVLVAASLRDLAGAVVLKASAQRRGDRLTFTQDGRRASCSLLLRNVAAARVCTGGIETKATAQGIRVEIPAECRKLELSVVA